MLTVKLFHVILSLCLYGDKRFEIIEKAMNRAGANARLGNTDYPLSTLKVHSTKNCTRAVPRICWQVCGIKVNLC